MIKTPIYVIAALILVVIGGGILWRMNYNDMLRPTNITPTSSTSPTSTSQNTPSEPSVKDITSLIFYNNPEFGLSLSFPNTYKGMEPSARDSILSLVKEVSDGGRQYFIMGNPIVPEANQSFEEAIRLATVYGPSGLAPKSISAFTKKRIGNFDFYTIPTERFEGTISYAFYFIKDNFIVPITVTWYPAPWTDSKYIPEKDPRYAEALTILASIKNVTNTFGITEDQAVMNTAWRTMSFRPTGTSAFSLAVPEKGQSTRQETDSISIASGLDAYINVLNLYFAPDDFPQKNLVGDFRVGLKVVPTVCATPQNALTQESVTLGKNTFKHFIVNDAAMGAAYKFEMYSIERGSSCYYLYGTIMTRNPRHGYEFPEAQNTEIEKNNEIARVQSALVLRDMATSLKFVQ